MRKNFSQDERHEYREKKESEFKERIVSLAQEWHNNPEDIYEYFKFQAKFRHYSARNTMLIYSQNPHASFVGSFKVFKDMGYNVLKGEHGMSISVYAPIKFFRHKENSPWRRLLDASDQEKQMIRAGMLETREQPHFKVGTVFDISQTNCPIQDYPKLLGLGYSDTQHAAIYAEISKYSEQIGMPVKEVDLKSVSLRGSYNPYTSEISINRILGDTQKLSTLMHEMAHGIMEHKTGAEGKSTAQREFEADALSIMFAMNLNIPITDGRKTHLSQVFKEYMIELQDKEADEDIEIDKEFQDITHAYQLHSERIENLLEHAGILPAVQDTTYFSVHTIEGEKETVVDGLTSLEAAQGHIEELVQNSENALKTSDPQEAWKILGSNTHFVISSNSESIEEYNYVQGYGLQSDYALQEEEFEITIS